VTGRRILLGATALWLALAGCTPGPSASKPRFIPQGGAVAVWDLDDLSSSADQGGLGETLAGPVIEVLQARGYQVVERQRLLVVLEELRLGSASLADESTRLRLGRLSGARWMIFGGYQTIGGRTRIDLRLVEVETGRVLKAAQGTATSDGVPQVVEAARKAARDLLPGG
jgi:TolB-like protein